MMTRFADGVTRPLRPSPVPGMSTPRTRDPVREPQDHDGSELDDERETVIDTVTAPMPYTENPICEGHYDGFTMADMKLVIRVCENDPTLEVITLGALRERREASASATPSP